ncbi:MAG: hypothetical protein ACLT0Y_03890 [Christensenellales bacterium]
MALVRELEDHGCDLKASVICKYTKQEVQRCNACEYKSLTDEQRKQVVIDYYLEQGLLDEYPIDLKNEEGTCALCRKNANKAATQTYANYQQMHGRAQRPGGQRGKDQRWRKLPLKFPPARHARKTCQGKMDSQGMDGCVCDIGVCGNGADQHFHAEGRRRQRRMMSFGIFAACCLVSFGVYYIGVKRF